MVEPTVPATVVVVLVIDRLADGATVSVSEAWQMPDVQETDGLVLVTAAGGAIRAVLMTWVCAETSAGEKTPRNSKARDTAKSRTPQAPSRKKHSFARVPSEIKRYYLCKQPSQMANRDGLATYTCSLIEPPVL